MGACQIPAASLDSGCMCRRLIFPVRARLASLNFDYTYSYHNQLPNAQESCPDPDRNQADTQSIVNRSGLNRICDQFQSFRHVGRNFEPRVGPLLVRTSIIILLSPQRELCSLTGIPRCGRIGIRNLAERKLGCPLRSHHSARSCRSLSFER